MNEDQLKEKFEEFRKTHLTKLNVAREVTKLIVHHSVSAVVATLVTKYCPTENRKQKLELAVASYIIAGMFADRAVDWAAQEFDNKVEFVQKAQKEIEELLNKTEEQKTVTEVPTEV